MNKSVQTSPAQPPISPHQRHPSRRGWRPRHSGHLQRPSPHRHHSTHHRPDAGADVGMDGVQEVFDGMPMSDPMQTSRRTYADLARQRVNVAELLLDKI
uniref:Uncharacterized protein n=1 Tax=Saccharum spontaneum TaxID=62335 RepID=A0A678THU5_SACSP|nr:hypothetical protein SS48H02_000001 [Saccharum spontaneum]